MKSIPFAEQETIIHWCADEKTATVTTSNATVMRKLDKLCEEAPDQYRRVIELDDEYDARYEVPVKLVRFGKPASEAQREARRKAWENGLGTKINSSK